MEINDAYRYSLISVFVFGILGNILVIISINLRKRKLLKNNYYFLVLQLAICDLGWLVVNFFDVILFLYNFVEKELNILRNFVTYCLVIRITFLFQVTGIYMMLVISVLRYRATVHPLKPAVSRRKLRVVCILGYILGLIAGY